MATPEEMLEIINRATYDAIVKMRAGALPKLAPMPLDEFSDRYIKPLVASAVSDAAFGYYPNGCPVLSEGPQKDDL